MLKRLWNTDAPLTATGLLMLPALAIFVVGLVVDPRLVTNAPVWLKPAKFAASIAIYSWTLAWTFTFIPEWARTRRIVGRVSAAVLILEMAIIAGQAWRGTTSHFNIGTPLDAALFGVMGLAIVTQTLTSIAVAVALWRQPFTDRALGTALRLGTTITIIGALIGGLMTRPTSAQNADMAAGHRPMIAGAHTVGAPDGGPGWPGTGWSREHGDIRVAHFVGLHALQVLPIIALATRRRLTAPARALLMNVAGASYAALVALLLADALRGRPLFAIDPLSAVSYGVWLTLSVAMGWIAVTRREPRTVAFI